MRRAFEKKLSLVRIRCSINLLLRQMGLVLTVAGAIAVLSVLTERLLALSIIRPTIVWTFGAAAIALGFLLWLLNLPSRMQASLLLDQRLRLHERFSTTLVLANSKDPFANAACAEARQTAQHVNLKGQFPIRPSRCWLYVVTTWLIAVTLVLFLPQKDLLGFLSKNQQEQESAQQLQQAKVDVKEATDTVKLAVKQLGDPNLSEELAKLDKPPKNVKPEDVKREAIRKLGDLSDRVRQMQADVKHDSVRLMQQMFKQMQGSPGLLSQQLRLALAKGEFGKASNLMSELQKQLAEGKLSDQQRKALSEQLQNLAKRLQELAKRNEELEKEFEKLGLDKALAKLSEKQLREALLKQGLNLDKIEMLLKKAAASRMASRRCASLGQAMAACSAGAGGLSGDELAGAIGQLDELEGLQQQFMLCQASLDEIGRAIACLGEGMCEGIGRQGPFAEGLSQRYGPGTGGPGRGYGPRTSDTNGETSTKRTRIKGDNAKQGPIIASWYFKSSQVKGDAKRDFAEVIQAARESAAEAISENQIPRKYEEAVKNYFGQIEQSGAK